MAAKNTIEAKLRIAAEVAQGVQGLRQVRDEAVKTQKALNDSARGATGTPELAAQTRQRVSAEREVAAAAKKATQDKVREERAAAAERLRLERELAREQRRLQREQVAERRRLEREAEAERKRAQRAEDSRVARERRGANYRSAALAPQLADVGVSLAGGQNPLLVALQQGTQISDIYGGLGNTLRALGSVITPLRVAIGGLATAGLALGGGFLAGWRESVRLTKQLAVMGSASGITTGLVEDLAQAQAAAGQSSIGFAREAAAAAAGLSGQTDRSLRATARAIAGLARLTGQSAEEVAQGFATQGDGITEWALKANRAYGFLTAAQVAYIASLERQGRVAEAIKFTNDELAASMEQRQLQAIGSIERGWIAATEALSRFLDLLKSIGRPTPLTQQIDASTAAIKSFDEAIKNLERENRDTSKVVAARDMEVDRRRELLKQANREVEKTQQSRNEQEQIRRESVKSAQAELASAEALAQKELAQRKAKLDEEQALTEAAAAKELITESDKALALNRIARDRAQAELDALLRVQRQASQGSKQENKEEQQAREIRLAQLAGQIATARAALKVNQSEAQRIVNAEILRLDRDLETRRSDIDARQAALDTDPRTRAIREADAAARRFGLEEDQIRNRRNELIAQGQGNAEILARLKEQLELAEQQTRAAFEQGFLASVRAQRQEVEQQLELALRAIDLEQDLSLASAGQIALAEARKTQARLAAVPVLEKLIELEGKYARSPADRSSVQAAQQTVQGLREVRQAADELGAASRQALGDGFAQVFRDIAGGAKNAKEILQDMVSSFASTMLDLISRRLGEQLLNSLWPTGNGARGSAVNTGAGGLFANLIEWWSMSFHNGGVIGRDSGSRSPRRLPASAWAGAQVLHSGGLVGPSGPMLMPNERPIIAQVGEEMLTQDDPRHRDNFTGFGPAIGTLSVSVHTGGGEDMNAERAQQLGRGLKSAVQAYIRDEQRPGGLLSSRPV